MNFSAKLYWDVKLITRKLWLKKTCYELFVVNV